MPKKNSTAAPNPDSAAEPTSAAPRRRRAPAKRAIESTAPASVADDRAASMPEPAGQRVTPADTSTADSVTFTSTANDTPTYEQIAEAAYQRYLSRGGGDGRDFDDWIEAERELKAR